MQGSDGLEVKSYDSNFTSGAEYEVNSEPIEQLNTISWDGLFNLIL